MSDPDTCQDCKRFHASKVPEFDRDPRYCYVKIQGRSRRAERNCAGVTIRRLQDRVRELESWKNEVLISHRIGETSIAAAIAIANGALTEVVDND